MYSCCDRVVPRVVPRAAIWAQAILVRVSWCTVGPAHWVLVGAGPRPEHDVKLLALHGVYFRSNVRDDVPVSWRRGLIMPSYFRLSR